MFGPAFAMLRTPCGNTPITMPDSSLHRSMKLEELAGACVDCMEGAWEEHAESRLLDFPGQSIRKQGVQLRHVFGDELVYIYDCVGLNTPVLGG